jgi:60 kDa SS-A/Ro ribonucleoprotein
MNDPLLATGTKVTPQSEQADPRQVQNNAGGYTFKIGGDARLHRFLTLGTEGGTYYVKERALTKDNAKVVTDWARRDASTLASRAREISVAGRAPKNNPALYALAAASALGDDAGRRTALDYLPDVARTGTHLFTWAAYRELFGGWGRGSRRAVADWYLGKDPDRLAYQLVKYRQRNGWAHRDLLRLSHPRRAPDDPEKLRQSLADGRLGLFTDPAHRALFDFTEGRNRLKGELPQVIHAFNAAWAAEKDTGLTETVRVREWVRLVHAMAVPGMGSLPWEALPDRALKSPDVWRALIENGMPQTALLRQLPRLTNLGVLEPMSDALRTVCAQLTDKEKLIKARVHPVSVLIALKTYAAGRSQRGDSTWTPVPQVIDALNDAFYLAYGAVEPSGKRTMLALDVSGSMTSPVAGIAGLSCREASAALALVTAATEKDYLITGFTAGSSPTQWAGFRTGISELSISPKQRLDDAVRSIANLPFGGTDCALPMAWAFQNKVAVDTFAVFTDSETWAGNVHPHQALKEYRQHTGIDARLAVVAMTPTEFSIADPEDPGSLDVSGFDSAVPSLLADFSRGDI